jgi:hypothetical protein
MANIWRSPPGRAPGHRGDRHFRRAANGPADVVNGTTDRGYTADMHPDVWNEAETALDDIDFPAGKDDIVAHAQRRTDHADVVRLLKALPPGTYDNLVEVRRSVRVDPAADEGQTTSEKVDQVRSRHSRQIAEHLRDRDQPVERRRGGV